MEEVNPVNLVPLVFIVLWGASIWLALYNVTRKKVFPNQSPEFSSRIIAGLHAVSMIILASACIYEGPNPFDGGEGEPNTTSQIITMVTSLSYFFYDFCWCLYYQTEPLIMLLHHLASIASLTCMIVLGSSGAVAVFGLLTMEVTNPLLQARWFLRTAGYNRTFLHTLVEWMFILLFLFMRLYYGSRMTLSVMKSENVLWQVKACTGSLFLISIIFIYQIYELVKKKYFYRA